MTSRKDFNEEEEKFKYGRLLGVLKRIDPESYELVHELSASEGISPIELIARAVRTYRDTMVLQSIDPKCFSTAMGVMDMLMRRVVGIMNTVIGFFMSDFYRTQMTVFQEMLKGVEEEETKEKKEKKELPPKVKEAMANVMANLMTNLMTTVMNAVMNATKATASGQGIPTPQTTAPDVDLTKKFGRKPKIRES